MYIFQILKKMKRYLNTKIIWLLKNVITVIWNNIFHNIYIYIVNIYLSNIQTYHNEHMARINYTKNRLREAQYAAHDIKLNW